MVSRTALEPFRVLLPGLDIEAKINFLFSFNMRTDIASISMILNLLESNN